MLAPMSSRPRAPASRRTVPVLVAALAALLIGVTGVSPAAAAGARQTTAGSTAAVDPAARGGVPAGFVRHRSSRFWTWFGPRSWISSDGAYGITQSSADGSRIRDLGFSSTQCSSGRTAREAALNHFAAKRSQLPVTFTSVGGARNLGGAFFVQTSAFRFRSSGSAFRGELVLHYDAQPTSGYCFEQNDARTAPARGFAQSLSVLRSVARYTFYCGPGAEEPGPDDPPGTC